MALIRSLFLGGSLAVGIKYLVIWMYSEALL